MKSIVGAKVQAKDLAHYEKMKDNKNEHLFSEDGVDLITKCLKFDPEQRLSAKDAMEHPFFEGMN